MELREHVRALADRWAGIVLAAVVGLVLATAAAALAPAGHTSTVGFYVGAAVVDGREDPAYATLVDSEVLPSVAALARSPEVLAPVASRLGLPDSPGELADRVEVAARADLDLLDVTVTDPSPERATALAAALAEVLPRRVDALYPGSSGPLLTVEVVRPATAGRPGGPSPGLAAVLGALAGAGLATLAVGAAQLARPRVRGVDDVRETTCAPVVALPLTSRAVAGPPRGDAPGRPEQLARLRALLAGPGAAGPGCRVALVAAGPADVHTLAGEVSAAGTGPRPVPVGGPGRPAPAGSGRDGVLVVADGRGTTRAQLREAVAAVSAAGLPLTGVVLDGLLPARARWRARLRAGLRGDARWSDGGRAPRSSPPVAGPVPVALAVAALGFSRPLPLALSTGLLASLALLPVWLPAVRRHRGAGSLVTLTALGLLSGALLAWSAARDHAIALHEASATTTAVLTAVCGTGMLLWARTRLSLPSIGGAFGAGWLTAGLLSVPGSENAWKFQLSAPLAVLALSAAAAVGRTAVTVAVLAALGVANVLNDARSAFAFCALAAVLVLWQARPHTGARPTGWWTGLPALGVLAAGGYLLLRELLLAGVLGAELQARTAEQISRTGSLLLGGRPEWTATWALMQHSPLGFGLGVVPSAADVHVAREGLAVTRIPTVDAYLENYLLAGGVELHSIVADLWAGLGPAGLLLGVLMGFLAVRGLAGQLAARTASGLVCLLVPLGTWSLAFGPLPTDVPTLTLALGLLLAPRSPGAGPPTVVHPAVRERPALPAAAR